MTIGGHSCRAELDATRYIIFLGAQRGANCADSTEFLGISVCYPPRQPESFGSGEEKKRLRKIVFFSLE